MNTDSKKMWWTDGERICRAQESEKCWSVVSRILNIRVPQDAVIFLGKGTTSVSGI